MSKRTCPMKHHCARQSFALKNTYEPDSPAHEYKYEVWDTCANLDPEWDDDTNERMVFESDDIGACVKFLESMGLSHASSLLSNTRAHIGNYEVRENGVCDVCDMYDKRKADLAEGRVQPFYIVAYGISRCYGGPEEGGWWYDWTNVHEVRRAFTVQEGIRQAHQLQGKYPQPRFNRFSCANDDEDDNYIVFCYGENDPRWPVQSTQRPRYE